MSKEEIEHLQWIHDRIISVYGENDVSERWVDFIKDNFTPKSQIDKERKEALEALLHVITDIEMLRTNTWEPDDDSCNATTDNLKLVIKYIEKTKRV